VALIVCVLRSGGEFLPEHAARLHGQAMQHSPAGTEFICLTDLVDEVQALGVPAAPLVHDWPSWWAKQCAFLLPGPCLYLDLDVTIMGDLSQILAACKSKSLIALRDWHNRSDWIQASVMGWRRDVSSLPKRLASRPEHYMRRYSIGRPDSVGERYGDQSFIHDYWRSGISWWQKLVPHQILSYRHEWRRRPHRPVVPRHDCRILVYTGWPRPWDKAEDLPPQEYKARQRVWRESRLPV
jgi:hypothetical protein